jgi:hypothetical protein
MLSDKPSQEFQSYRLDITIIINIPVELTCDETFIREDLHVSDAERTQFALEDIYTPIDKAIFESTSSRSYPPQRLLELRENINNLIKMAVRETITRAGQDKSYATKFAKHVVKLSKERIVDDKIDKVGIITQNPQFPIQSKYFDALFNSNLLTLKRECFFIDEDDSILIDGEDSENDNFDADNRF